jgi:hypothetical protein
MSRRGRLRVAAVACLVAGLFPHYARTPRPDGQPGSATVDVRLGLPFSPVFRYRYERREPATSSFFEGNRVEYSSASSWFSSWGVYVSLSAALVVAGAVLLVISFRTLPPREPRG